MSTDDGPGSADPTDVVRALAAAIRADGRKLHPAPGPGFEIRATVVTPGRVYDSLDARFADLRAAYEVVQVLPDVDTMRVLDDGRIAISGEAHLTRADGAGVSTPIHWIATVDDGRVVLIEGVLG